LSAFAEIMSKQVLVSIFAVIFTVMYGYAAKILLFKTRERRLQRKKELDDCISKGIRNRTIESVDDLILIYKGVYGHGADDISYRAGLSKTLRELLVGLLSGTSSEKSEVLNIKNRIKQFIYQIESESPFANLPTAERNLIVDIQRFTSVGDIAASTEKLSDLAGLIEIRQDALDRLQNSNKWSIPLATIGLVLTIVFGVISLVK